MKSKRILSVLAALLLLISLPGCARLPIAALPVAGSADSVTGIIYEPWHFRYVGVEAAHYMMDNNLCLEEFLALYGVV